MKLLHPQPPELCARCGEEVKDLEWVLEQEDAPVAHWRCIHGQEVTWARQPEQLEIAW